MKEHIVQAWEQIKHDYHIGPEETIYFSYDWHDEDSQTVQFLKNVLLKSVNGLCRNTRHCRCGRWYIYAEWRKIKYLYRLYPIEYLVTDVDKNGKRIGLQF